MSIKLFTYWISCILILFSCNSREREIKKTLNQWIGKELKIPDLKLKIIGRDTFCEDLWEKNYKVLTYVDTAGCTPCRLHPVEWRTLIREAQDSLLDLNFIFIVSSSDYKTFEKMESMNYFYFPVYYDPSLKFQKLNGLPSKEYLNSFLVDKNNKIVAIGNPATNDKVWELYKKIICSN